MIQAILETGTAGQLDTLALVATVVGTIILALATLYQAIKTGAMVKEMKETRFGEIEPRVKASLGWIGPVSVSLKIQNLGRGPAKNLAIEISFKPGDETPKKWSQQVMASGEYARLFLDPIEFDQLAAKYDEICVKGTCENATGRKYDINDIINLKEIQETLKKTPQLMELSNNEILKDIQTELEKLNSNLETAIRGLTRTGIVTKTKAERAAEDEEFLSKAKELRDKAKSKTD